MDTIRIQKEGKGVWVGIVIPRGSRYELEDDKGISHFLEHMLFKGTFNRTKDILKLALDKYGATLNAYTDYEHTCYWAYINKEHYTEAIDILTDMVSNSVIPENEVDKEREVIYQEFKSYRDSPNLYIWELVNSHVFNKSSGLHLPIIGTMKSLKSITREKLYDYYKKGYKKSTLITVGDLGISRVLPSYKSTISPITIPEFDNSSVLITKKGISQANMLMSGLIVSENRLLDYFTFKLLRVMHNAFCGRLFDTIREKNNLVYTVYFSNELFRCGTNQWFVYAGLNADKIEKAKELILKELIRPFTKKELEIGQTKLLGQLDLILEDTEHVGTVVANSLVKDLDYSAILKDYKKYIKKAATRVNTFVEQINFSNNKLVALVPEKQE